MFRLPRYFSIAAGCAIALLTNLLVGLNAWHEQKSFVAFEERHNTTMAHALYNALGPPFEAYLATAYALDRQSLLRHPQTAAIDATVVTAVRDLPALKVKIYCPLGATLYSSEHADIGMPSNHVDHIKKAAKTGLPVSQIETQQSFVALDGLRSNIRIIGTYVPMKDATGKTIAVLEVYSDITAQSLLLKRDMLTTGMSILGAFSALFCVLYIVVRHADRILVKQHQELLSFNNHLEERIVERTQLADTSAAEAHTAARRWEGEVEDRRRIEQELLQQRAWLLDQQLVLGDLIRRDMTAEGDWSKSIQHLLERASDTLGVCRASVWMFSPARDAMQCVDLYCKASGIHESGGQFAIDPASPYVLALESDAVIAAADGNKDPRLVQFADSYLRPLGITSVLEVPIIRDARTSGVFSVGHVGAPRLWRPEHQAFAS